MDVSILKVAQVTVMDNQYQLLLSFPQIHVHSPVPSLGINQPPVFPPSCHLPKSSKSLLMASPTSLKAKYGQQGRMKLAAAATCSPVLQPSDSPLPPATPMHRWDKIPGENWQCSSFSDKQSTASAIQKCPNSSTQFIDRMLSFETNHLELTLGQDLH